MNPTVLIKYNGERFIAFRDMEEAPPLEEIKGFPLVTLGRKKWQQRFKSEEGAVDMFSTIFATFPMVDKFEFKYGEKGIFKKDQYVVLEDNQVKFENEKCYLI